GQRAQDLERAQDLGRLAQPISLRRHLLPQAGEELVLQQPAAISRRQHFLLKPPQFVSDKAFGVYQRLPAQVALRHRVEVGLRHFQIIAKDLIEPDSEIGNAGSLSLLLLKPRQPPAAVGLDRAQLVQLGRDSNPDDPSLFGQSPRLIYQDLLDLSVNVLQRVHRVT